MEAEPDGRYYRVYGSKFFCSAVHADYAVVTAKVTGSEKVGTFIVPSWLPGDKEKEKRNGYVINRIKWKLGTVELPTAEIDFQGALAYPIGPTDRGCSQRRGDSADALPDGRRRLQRGDHDQGGKRGPSLQRIPRCLRGEKSTATRWPPINFKKSLRQRSGRLPDPSKSMTFLSGWAGSCSRAFFQ